MLLDLLPLFDTAAPQVIELAVIDGSQTFAPTLIGGDVEETTGGGAVRYPNPLPPHRRPVRLRDDEEALLVAALI